ERLPRLDPGFRGAQLRDGDLPFHRDTFPARVHRHPREEAARRSAEGGAQGGGRGIRERLRGQKGCSRLTGENAKSAEKRVLCVFCGLRGKTWTYAIAHRP